MNGCVCVTSAELGIALSGGGARGLAQLGVLKVLDREGIPVGYVAGTSAGAVVGAVYVTSKDAVEAEARILDHLRTTGVGFNMETFAPLMSASHHRSMGMIDVARRAWRLTRPGGALIGGDAMRESLRSLLANATFDGVRVPFATTALDIESGRRMIFAAGSLPDAVYASSAIPGLFEPLTLDEYTLVDGGWAEPVPVETCRHLGAIHVLAVGVGGGVSATGRGGAVSTALRADAMARHLLEEKGLKDADFLLRVNVEIEHFADLSEPEALIAAGEEAAEAELPSIRAVLQAHESLFVRPASTERSHSDGCHVRQASP